MTMASLRSALKALLFISAAFYSAQAQAKTCRELYNAIKSEATYCGFSCDYDRIRPLQITYEMQCIVVAISESEMGFDSSPEPTPVPAAYLAKTPQLTVPTGDHPAESRKLIEAVEMLDGRRFLSRPQRVRSASALLGYCKTSLARVGYRGPQVGLTEDSGDLAGAQGEFARWQLSTTFADCVEAAYGILDASDWPHEHVAWSKILKFLELDSTVRSLAITGDVGRVAKSESSQADLFGTGTWPAARAAIATAMKDLVAESALPGKLVEVQQKRR